MNIPSPSFSLDTFILDEPSWGNPILFAALGQTQEKVNAFHTLTEERRRRRGRTLEKRQGRMEEVVSGMLGNKRMMQAVETSEKAGAGNEERKMRRMMSDLLRWVNLSSSSRSRPQTVGNLPWSRRRHSPWPCQRETREGTDPSFLSQRRQRFRCPAWIRDVNEALQQKACFNYCHGRTEQKLLSYLLFCLRMT